MQWKNRVRKGRGFLSVAVLIVTAALLLLMQGFVQLIKQEVTAQTEQLRYQQIAYLGDTLLVALGNTMECGQPPPVKLYPGNEEVYPRLTIEQKTNLTIRRSSVGSGDLTHDLGRLLLRPPGGRDSAVYSNWFYAGKGITGDLPKGSQPQGYPISSIIPSIGKADLLANRNSTLPTAADLADFGLMDKLYVNTGDNTTDDYAITANTVISGNGVFYNDRNISIGQNCESSGRLWLISSGRITIGNRVRLRNVFIFTTGNLVIGDSVEITGIVIAKGTAKIGTGFKFNPAMGVLEDFSTLNNLN